MDLKAAVTKRKIQIIKLEEWREKAYHSVKLYKERIKRWHDKQVKTKQFKPGDKVLPFNSHVHLFGYGKLRSKWEGPYLVLHAADHDAVTFQCDDGDTFKANVQALNYSLSQILRILRKWMSSTSSSYNDYIHMLRDLNSIVIPRLGFSFSKIFFSKFSFQISKIRGRSEFSDLQGNFGKIPEFLGTTGHPAYPWALFNSVFSVAFYSLRDQRSYYRTVKFRGKEGFSPFKSLNSSPSPSLLFQNSCSSSPLIWIPSMLCPRLLLQGRSHW
jgi:hypothetical protein